MDDVERAAWVSRWTQSGQSVRAFAREHQLSAHSLGRWLREVRRGGSAGQAAEPAPKFHTVSLPVLSDPEWAAELELPSGRRLRIRAGVSAGWVKELVEALR
jgi:transposase-like protein